MLMPNGEVLLGAGDGPNGNVCGLMSEAVAAMFCFRGLPRLFICGPTVVKCAAEFGVPLFFEGDKLPPAEIRKRVWSFAGVDPEGWRLYVWSSGAIVGIGRTQEEVGRAVEAIQTAMRRRGGADARDLQRHSR